MATPISLGWKRIAPAGGHAKAVRRGSSMVLVYLFFLALAMPIETSIFLGPLRISPYRLVLILAIIPCVFHLATGAAGRLVLPDVLLFLHVLWAAAALIHAHGLNESWQFSGIYAIETLMPYLIARCYIRSADDFAKAVKLHFAMVVLLIPLTFYESVTGHHLIKDVARALFGGAPPPQIEPRLGLARAFGPFEHPIAYGVFCASSLGAALYVLGRGRTVMGLLWRAGVVTVATFFSLSAGPLVTILAQGGLIAWERMTRRLRHRWALLGGLFAGSWAGVSLLSTRSPLLVFIWYFTFNVHTAYYRVLIWRYGSEEVARHPFLGIGLNDWQRPDWMGSSIDNFWLVEALRYGLPALLLFGGAVILICTRLGALKGTDDRVLDYRNGLVITIIGLSIAGATVHFWNAVYCLFMFLLGSGIWMLEEKPERSRAAAARRRPRGRPAGAAAGGTRIWTGHSG